MNCVFYGLLGLFILLISGCATTSPESENHQTTRTVLKDGRFQTETSNTENVHNGQDKQPAQDDTEELFAQMLKRRNSDQEEPKKDHKKIDAEYGAYTKRNICEKKYWSRYESSEFFYTAAKEGKITPYDFVWGDEYTKRNVPKSKFLFLVTKVSDYLVELPEAVSEKFNQELSSEEMTKNNKRAVFNNSIQRDYACYKKLK